MPIAINPQTGDAVYLDDDGAWQPARTAANPQTGERLAWDGRAWQAIGPAAPAEPKTSGLEAFGRGAAQGATFGFGDEFSGLQAAAFPDQTAEQGALRRSAIPMGMGPVADAIIGAGRLGYEKLAGGDAATDAYQRVRDEQRARNALADEERPISSGFGNLAGTAATLIPAGMTGIGARLLGAGASTLPRAVAQGAASGAGLGALDAVGRDIDIGTGAGIGAGLGGALPVVARVAGAVARPIISNIQARRDPAGYARSQAARVVGESGRTPADLAADVAQAAAEGQPQYALADALGNAGQRALAGVARAPGEGRTAAVNFLEQRQAGQGRRVANALAEGFAAPETAAQMRTRLVAARNAAADVDYGAVRADAGPVNVTRTIGRIDQTLRPGLSQFADPAARMAPDSVEAALTAVRNRLTDGRSLLTDFESLQRVRGDLADAIGRAERAGEGNKVRLLSEVRTEMDRAMEEASEGFRQANAQYAARSRVANPRGEDIITQGRDAALRGRTENTIPAFRELASDAERAGFRTGYVDPLIEQTQGAAVGVNKARALTSDAFADEAAAMAPGADLLQRRIGRENTMFETRRQATGGSQTADNLADAAALGEVPALAQQILTGNFGGIIRTSLQAIARHATGSTPEVRRELANLLLMQGGRVTAPELQRLLNEAVQQVRQNRTRALLATQLTGRVGGLQASRAAESPQQR